MRIGNAVDWLETLINPLLAEPWDNVGLLLGDGELALNKAIFCIDATRAVVQDAARSGAQLLVAYHPPLFKGVKRFASTDPVYLAARAEIAIWSPHTAFDVAPGGTNDVLAELLSLKETTPLSVTAAPLGLGRVGNVAKALSSAQIVDTLKRALGVSHVLVAREPGRAERDVTRIAVAAGSGADLIGAAVASGAQALVTGELRHHDALAAVSAGLDVYCVLHSNSERIAVSRLCDKARSAWTGVACEMSALDVDPFVIR